MPKCPPRATPMVASVLLFLPTIASAVEPSTHASSESKVVVEHAEIVLAPQGSKMMAGYLAIWNGTQQHINLSNVDSDAFGSITLHRTELEDGVARMRSVDGDLSIPGHSELVMKPGGIHMMLMQPSAELKPDAQVDLLLTFQDGATVPVTATVRPMGRRPTAHHHGEADQQEDPQ